MITLLKAQLIFQMLQNKDKICVLYSTICILLKTQVCGYWINRNVHKENGVTGVHKHKVSLKKTHHSVTPHIIEHKASSD